MNRVAITLSLAAAFAAGCSVTHLLRPAIAAENITAQVIHTGELEGDALGAPNAGGMRSKLYVAADRESIKQAPELESIQSALDLTETGPPFTII